MKHLATYMDPVEWAKKVLLAKHTTGNAKRSARNYLWVYNKAR